MVNPGPREPRYGDEQDRADAEYAKQPATVVWEKIRGGIWISRSVEEHGGRPGRRPRPPCECEIYGSAKQRVGAHHDDSCSRRHPW